MVPIYMCQAVLSIFFDFFSIKFHKKKTARFEPFTESKLGSDFF